MPCSLSRTIAIDIIDMSVSVSNSPMMPGTMYHEVTKSGLYQRRMRMSIACPGTRMPRRENFSASISCDLSIPIVCAAESADEALRLSVASTMTCTEVCRPPCMSRA